MAVVAEAPAVSYRLLDAPTCVGAMKEAAA
jgi:hypothetical protein